MKVRGTALIPLECTYKRETLKNVKSCLFVDVGVAAVTMTADERQEIYETTSWYI